MALDRMLRRAEVERATGLSRSAIYDLMRRGQFPEPVQMTPKAVRWPESEIADWLASRPRATGEIGDPARQRGAGCATPSSPVENSEVTHGDCTDARRPTQSA